MTKLKVSIAAWLRTLADKLHPLEAIPPVQTARAGGPGSPSGPV